MLEFWWDLLLFEICRRHLYLGSLFVIYVWDSWVARQSNSRFGLDVTWLWESFGPLVVNGNKMRRGFILHGHF